MVEGEIPEATAAAEVLFQVVQPLGMGWKFGSSAMVKELFFVDLCVCVFVCVCVCLCVYLCICVFVELIWGWLGGVDSSAVVACC